MKLRTSALAVVAMASFVIQIAPGGEKSTPIQPVMVLTGAASGVKEKKFVRVETQEDLDKIVDKTLSFQNANNGDHAALKLDIDHYFAICIFDGENSNNRGMRVESVRNAKRMSQFAMR